VVLAIGSGLQSEIVKKKSWFRVQAELPVVIFALQRAGNTNAGAEQERFDKIKAGQGASPSRVRGLISAEDVHIG
jgi:hypothetical protein